MAEIAISRETAVCQHCGSSFDPKPRQKYCQPCGYAVRLEANKLRRRKLALAAGKAQRPTSCVDCNCDLPSESKYHRCPECWLAAKRKRNREREERLRREGGAAMVGDTMPCAGCGSEVRRTSGARKFCPECRRRSNLERHRIANRKYEEGRPPRKRNSVADRERQRRYAARNRDRLMKQWRKYNDANREEINRKARERNRTERRRQYMRVWGRKQAQKPHYKVDQRMSASIASALRGRKSGRSWEKLVGYTLAELTVHLERQFARGMSWENIGEWHIDHIIPKASFNYEDASDPEFKAAWALTNLRPLWAPVNLSKGAKRLLLL